MNRVVPARVFSGLTFVLAASALACATAPAAPNEAAVSAAPPVVAPPVGAEPATPGVPVQPATAAQAAGEVASATAPLPPAESTPAAAPEAATPATVAGPVGAQESAPSTPQVGRADPNARPSTGRLEPLRPQPVRTPRAPRPTAIPSATAMPPAATPAPAPRPAPAPAQAPGPAYSGPDPCTLATKGDSPVAKACREGGVKAAKVTMKELLKQGRANGVKYQCDDCHVNDADYAQLSQGAEEKFAKLVAAARR